MKLKKKIRSRLTRIPLLNSLKCVSTLKLEMKFEIQGIEGNAFNNESDTGCKPPNQAPKHKPIEINRATIWLRVKADTMEVTDKKLNATSKLATNPASITPLSGWPR